MKVDALMPPAEERMPFRRSHARHVPMHSGCYALTTFEGIVLYVGLASDLRGRMNQHLDDPEKTLATELGRAVWFHWRCASKIAQLERTWLNMHEISEGCRPVLNRIASPVST